uniref:Secreted protein n=1 Tax=Ixodes ricinus TaxID=34613 RepID=A0A6B0UJG3_IXORI
MQPSTTQIFLCHVGLLLPPTDSSLDNWNICDSFPTDSLVGRGQSSRMRVMTAGPRGSSMGMALTIDLTTRSQPDSLSASRCSLIMNGGGSCSLSTRVLMMDSVSRMRCST